MSDEIIVNPVVNQVIVSRVGEQGPPGTGGGSGQGIASATYPVLYNASTNVVSFDDTNFLKNDRTNYVPYDANQLVYYQNPIIFSGSMQNTNFATIQSASYDSNLNAWVLHHYASPIPLDINLPVAVYLYDNNNTYAELMLFDIYDIVDQNNTLIYPIATYSGIPFVFGGPTNIRGFFGQPYLTYINLQISDSSYITTDNGISTSWVNANHFIGDGGYITNVASAKYSSSAGSLVNDSYFVKTNRANTITSQSPFSTPLTITGTTEQETVSLIEINTIPNNILVIKSDVQIATKLREDEVIHFTGIDSTGSFDFNNKDVRVFSYVDEYTVRVYFDEDFNGSEAVLTNNSVFVHTVGQSYPLQVWRDADENNEQVAAIDSGGKVIGAGGYLRARYKDVVPLQVLGTSSEITKEILSMSPYYDEATRQLWSPIQTGFTDFYFTGGGPSYYRIVTDLDYDNVLASFLDSHGYSIKFINFDSQLNNQIISVTDSFAPWKAVDINGKLAIAFVPTPDQEYTFDLGINQQSSIIILKGGWESYLGTYNITIADTRGVSALRPITITGVGNDTGPYDYNQTVNFETISFNSDGSNTVFFTPPINTNLMGYPVIGPLSRITTQAIHGTNLQEWKLDDNTILSYIDKDGIFNGTISQTNFSALTVNHSPVATQGDLSLLLNSYSPSNIRMSNNELSAFNINTDPVNSWYSQISSIESYDDTYYLININDIFPNGVDTKFPFFITIYKNGGSQRIYAIKYLQGPINGNKYLLEKSIDTSDLTSTFSYGSVQLFSNVADIFKIYNNQAFQISGNNTVFRINALGSVYSPYGDLYFGGKIYGNGSFLTNISASNIVGTVASVNYSSSAGVSASTTQTNFNTLTVGTLNVSGSAFISGSTVIVSSSNVSTIDPLIYVGMENPSNINDLGIIGSFTSGSYQHTGIVRDHTDGVWKLFSGVTTEPTNVVDFTSASYDTLKVGGVLLNSTSAQPLTTEGTLYYESTTHSPTIITDTTSPLHLVQQQFIRARNAENVTITKGQVVYLSGALGANPTVNLAIANSASTHDAIGVVYDDIAVNGTGWILTKGLLEGINTTGYSSGSTLYLSASVAGGLTTTKPSYPSYAYVIGKALNSVGGGAGKIIVNLYDDYNTITSSGAIAFSDGYRTIGSANATLDLNGKITAASFVGNGSGLTNIDINNQQFGSYTGTYDIVPRYNATINRTLGTTTAGTAGIYYTFFSPKTNITVSSLTFLVGVAFAGLTGGTPSFIAGIYQPIDNSGNYSPNTPTAMKCLVKGTAASTIFQTVNSYSTPATPVALDNSYTLIAGQTYAVGLYFYVGASGAAWTTAPSLVGIGGGQTPLNALPPVLWGATSVTNTGTTITVGASYTFTSTLNSSIFARLS